MNNSVVLLSKDILASCYLPAYGNKYYKTPNIDELAEKGTVFYRHYTAAPSTAMAFTSMCSGKYPYELERRNYCHVDDMRDVKTIFDDFKDRGVKSHIVWSLNYNKAALPYANCFGDAEIHSIDINQPVGPHFKGMESIKRDDKRTEETMALIYRQIDEILDKNETVFLWIHLPHVILGRVSYGDDIDLLDEIVGYLREKVSDDNIFITADHGNMNAVNGKFAYGFDVNECVVRIPLITPRIDGISRVDFPTSNVDLKTIIFERHIPKRDYVIADSAYFAQPKRCTTIIRDEMKLIYDKYSKKYSLYNVKYDPEERMNLLEDSYVDQDRNVRYNLHEIYFYPYWNRVNEDYQQLKAILDGIWRKGNFYEEVICKNKHKLSNVKRRFSLIFKKGQFRK